MRYYLALWCAKFAYFALKVLGKSASTFPGAVALKICPEFLAESKKAPLTICVTGTNGKTTVTNTIANMLKDMGYNVRTNAIGANIATGIATVLMTSVNIFGKIKVDVDVCEVDERYSRLILPKVEPDYLVVTGIFRDSLKRNAHPEYIYSVINGYTPAKTKLILNADDLGSLMMGSERNAERHFFAIGPMEGDVTEPYNIISDHTLCPNCHTKLKFNYLRYHHIGNAYCPECGFASPKADYLVEKIDAENRKLVVNVKGETVEFPLVSDILFNVYNQTAVLSLLSELGKSNEEIADSFGRMEVVKSRLNTEECGNATLIKAMSKGQSAVSSCRTVDFLSKEEGDKSVVLLLDDWYERKDSSEFIGWIYDVDFEFLAKENVKQVLALGPRFADYKVRLKMAGIPEDRILCCSDEFEGVKQMKTEGIEKVYVLYDTSTIHLADDVAEKIKEKFRAVKEA